MEDRDNRKAALQMRKKGLYIVSPWNLTITGILCWNFRPRGRYFWPGGRITAPYCDEHHKKLSQNLEGAEIMKFPAHIIPPSEIPSPENWQNEQNENDHNLSAYWLYFRWSWARWNHNNEIHNFMHKNIIVQQRNINKKDKRFDLSSKTNR
jgi:hypothetical protein